MIYTFAFFIFFALANDSLIECQPTSDRGTLMSQNYGDNNVGFRISSRGIDDSDNGSTTKFAMLLKEKLAEVEKKMSNGNNVPKRHRRSGSMFYRLCVRFQHGRCLRRKRFGLWHKFRRDGTSKT